MKLSKIDSTIKMIVFDKDGEVVVIEGYFTHDDGNTSDIAKCSNYVHSHYFEIKELWVIAPLQCTTGLVK